MYISLHLLIYNYSLSIYHSPSTHIYDCVETISTTRQYHHPKPSTTNLLHPTILLPLQPALLPHPDLDSHHPPRDLAPPPPLVRR